MKRCKICSKATSAKIRLTEKRYFVGEADVCSDCFDHWASGDYDYLDKKAILKLGILT